MGIILPSYRFETVLWCRLMISGHVSHIVFKAGSPCFFLRVNDLALLDLSSRFDYDSLPWCDLQILGTKVL